MKILKNKKFKKSLILFSLLLISIFFYFGLKNQVITTPYEIEDERVVSDFKVILITDTHSCKYGKNQEELLDKIKIEKPDLIFLSGDIIDDHLPMETGFETIKNLSNLCPTFYVTGNHEFYSNKIAYIKDRISEYGIEVLEGGCRQIQIYDNLIDICGIDDPTAGSTYKKELKNLEGMKSENLTFLLAHRPERISDYKRLDVDYVFSGHAHGGQWRLPIILEDGLLSPNQGFFPKYTVGVKDFESFKLIISRGLSRESTKIFRFFNPPEVLVIDFKKKV